MAVACPTAVGALLVAALGGAVPGPSCWRSRWSRVTVAFAIGQPALIAS